MPHWLVYSNISSRSSHLEYLKCNCGKRILKWSVETVELKLCSNSSVITCCITYYGEACNSNKKKLTEAEGITLCNKISLYLRTNVFNMRAFNSLK